MVLAWHTIDITKTQSRLENELAYRLAFIGFTVYSIPSYLQILNSNGLKQVFEHGYQVFRALALAGIKP